MEIITSRRNPLAVHMKKLGADPGHRAQCGEFLCDGMVLLREAAGSDVRITSVLSVSPLPFDLPRATPFRLASQGVIESISALKNAQGVVFSCAMPAHNGIPDCSSGLSILLDGVQDPGNVGTIIRTACAFGAGAVLLREGCADPYNPKTIRASMGSIFKQRVCPITRQDLLDLNKKGAKFMAAEPRGDCMLISEANLHDKIIVIGSEGQGISDEMLAFCEEKVKIPISPQCESLNAAAAAAIIMWEARNAECLL